MRIEERDQLALDPPEHLDDIGVNLEPVPPRLAFQVGNAVQGCACPLEYLGRRCHTAILPGAARFVRCTREHSPRPRDPAFYDEPLRTRALGAHQNGIEAFPFFAVAVLLAEFRAGPQRLINELAILFLIVRIAYVLTYLGDRPTLRSILWSIGFAINLAIFFMPVIRNHLPI